MDKIEVTISRNAIILCQTCSEVHERNGISFHLSSYYRISLN